MIKIVSDANNIGSMMFHSSFNSKEIEESGAAEENVCSASGGVVEEYNVPLHIGSVFLVFIISAIGIFGILFLTSIVGNKPWLGKLIQLMKMFGIGVIAATAWLHLLPDAYESFGNPCLPSGWQFYGVNFVGVFGLLSSFIVQLIEVVAVSNQASACHELPKSQHQDHSATGPSTTGIQIRNEVPSSQSALSNPNYTNYASTASSSSSPTEATLTLQQAVPKPHGESTSIDNDLLKAHSIYNSKTMSVIILELGIIFHSLIIGLTLGVTPDDGFVTLLIAIMFHQLFEGMALGALIGSLSLSSVTKYLGFGLLYPTTTPIGIAIGIGIRNVYNENDASLILVQGILNSLSAGILFYNTYTELMSLEINHSSVFRGFTGTFKLACFIFMYLGAAAMAILAVWA